MREIVFICSCLGYIGRQQLAWRLALLLCPNHREETANVNINNNGGSTMAAPREVNTHAALTSASWQLESIFSLKEQQRTWQKVFINEKNVFTLLKSDRSSLIYQQALLVVLIVRTSKSLMIWLVDVSP